MNQWRWRGVMRNELRSSKLNMLSNILVKSSSFCLSLPCFVWRFTFLYSSVLFISNLITNLDGFWWCPSWWFSWLTLWFACLGLHGFLEYKYNPKRSKKTSDQKKKPNSVHPSEEDIKIGDQHNTRNDEVHTLPAQVSLSHQRWVKMYYIMKHASESDEYTWLVLNSGTV